MQVYIADFSEIKEKFRGSGMSASYYQLGRDLGVKVFTTDFDSIELLKKSWTYFQATRQAEALLNAEGSGHTPLFYELCILNFEGVFNIAIVMQHIEGSHPDFLGDGIEALAEDLENSHSVWIRDDLHTRNVIICAKTKKPYFIDFVDQNRG